jgi:hypothetical protein
MSLILARIAAAHRSVGGAPINIDTYVPGVAVTGASWNIAELGSLFTDTAGTIPAALGDSVALVKDRSGNGIDLSQATVAAQPVLAQDTAGHYYLQFSGAQVLSAGIAPLQLHTESVVGVSGVRFDDGLPHRIIYAKGYAGEYIPRYSLGRDGTNLRAFTEVQSYTDVAAGITDTSTAIRVITGVSDRVAGNTILRVQGTPLVTITFAGIPTTDLTTSTQQFLMGEYNGGYNYMVGRIYFLSIWMCSSIDYTKLSTLEAAVKTHIGA